MLTAHVEMEYIVRAGYGQLYVDLELGIWSDRQR